MDIKLNEFQAPVITINFEELKKAMEQLLMDYTGLVVTEDTLSACKSAQKELAGLRTKIDTYRKEKKKEAEKPIKAFEEQCKTLIKLVEQVEAPIKDGIKVYDDQKREEKRVAAEEIIANVAIANGLKEKYRAQLTVLDKYMNLTAKKKDVQEDVETRAFALKVEQDREEELLNIIQMEIDSQNSRIKTSKLTMQDFSYMINRGTETAVILNAIKAQGQKIYDAENMPKEEPKPVVEESKEEEKPSTVTEEPKAEQATPKMFTVTVKMVGTAGEMSSVAQFLKSNNINYEVLEQKAL